MSRLPTIAALLSLSAALAGIANPALYTAVTPAHLIPGAVSQDILCLLAALALLLGGGDGPRSAMTRIGLLAFLAYAYGIYVFEAALTTVFPLYLAIFACALWAVILSVPDLLQTPVMVRGAPRTLTAALFILFVVMFAVLWSAQLIPAMAEAQRPEAYSIMIFDFTVILPILLAQAIGLLRKSAVADRLALPLLVKMATLGLSVLLGTLLAPLFGRPLPWTEVPVYAMLGVLPALLIPMWWRAVPRDWTEAGAAPTSVS